LRDPTFSRFDTIPECDGHTDTRRRHIPRLARRHAVKMTRINSSCIFLLLCTVSRWMYDVKVTDRVTYK